MRCEYSGHNIDQINAINHGWRSALYCNANEGTNEGTFDATNIIQHGVTNIWMLGDMGGNNNIWRDAEACGGWAVFNWMWYVGQNSDKVASQFDKVPAGVCETAEIILEELAKRYTEESGIDATALIRK